MPFSSPRRRRVTAAWPTPTGYTCVLSDGSSWAWREARPCDDDPNVIQPAHWAMLAPPILTTPTDEED
jgi:hypothetical protein